MGSFIISYDLNKPGQDYQSLYNAIKNKYNWWHCLDSTWIVKSDEKSEIIRDYLKTYIDSSDSLLVCKLTGEAAWIGMSDKCSKWLKDNL